MTDAVKLRRLVCSELTVLYGVNMERDRIEPSTSGLKDERPTLGDSSARPDAPRNTLICRSLRLTGRV